MIHHVSVGTNDIKRSKAFYGPLMALIGFRILKESDKSIHYGHPTSSSASKLRQMALPQLQVMGFTSLFRLPTGELSDAFTKLPSQMAELTKGHLVFARIITPTITGRSFETSMETSSKQ